MRFMAVSHDNPMPAERQQHILAVLRTEGRVVAADLGHRLRCSDDTVRRDLDRLAAEGLVQRVHGGALAVNDSVVPYAVRAGELGAEKAAIAATAVRLIKPGSVVLLDGGTTCCEFARQLPPDIQATFITPSPTAALELVKRRDARVQLLGGQLSAETRSTVGAAVTDALHNIRPDLCVLGPCGLHPTLGISVSDIDELPVKVAMIDSALAVVALAVTQKLGTVLPFRVGPISKLTHLIVNDKAPESDLMPYRDQGINVISAHPNDA